MLHTILHDYKKSVFQFRTDFFSFYRRKDYKQLIERHKVLVSDLKRQLDISRILVSEACNDLMEVDIDSMTEVN